MSAERTSTSEISWTSATTGPYDAHASSRSADAEVCLDVDLGELEGRTLNGQYRIECLVFETRISIVYRAVDTRWSEASERWRQHVALKVLKPQPGLNAEELRAELRREATLLRRLECPAVVAVDDYDTTTVDGTLVAWMATRWIDGNTLAAEIRPSSRWAQNHLLCLKLLRPVIQALAAAHLEGIVHCDVKPSNIMVQAREDPDDMRAWLLDFGVARMLREATSRPRSAPGEGEGTCSFGTPGWAAPEQYRDPDDPEPPIRYPVGPWSDVFSLGRVIHALITGAVLRPEERPGPGTGIWERVLRRAGERDPRARYRDAGELVHALDEALAHSRAGSLRRTALVTGLSVTLVAAALYRGSGQRVDSPPHASPSLGRRHNPSVDASHDMSRPSSPADASPLAFSPAQAPPERLQAQPSTRLRPLQAQPNTRLRPDAPRLARVPQDRTDRRTSVSDSGIASSTDSGVPPRTSNDMPTVSDAQARPDAAEEDWCVWDGGRAC